VQAQFGLDIRVLQYGPWVKGLNPVFRSTGLEKHSRTTGEQHGIEEESKKTVTFQVAPEKGADQACQDAFGEGMDRHLFVRQIHRHK
jgi:hypothetical protein